MVTDHFKPNLKGNDEQSNYCIEYNKQEQYETSKGKLSTLMKKGNKCDEEWLHTIDNFYRHIQYDTATNIEAAEP